jgi:hypothetical protein
LALGASTETTGRTGSDDFAGAACGLAAVRASTVLGCAAAGLGCSVIGAGGTYWGAGMSGVRVAVTVGGAVRMGSRPRGVCDETGGPAGRKGAASACLATGSSFAIVWGGIGSAFAAGRIGGTLAAARALPTLA